MKLKSKLLIIIIIKIQEFNKLMSRNFTARLKQANLASKNSIVDLVKNIDFDNKLKKINKKLLQIN